MKTLLVVILIGAVSAGPTMPMPTPMASKYQVSFQTGSLVPGATKNVAAVQINLNFAVRFCKPYFVLKVDKCNAMLLPKMKRFESYPLCNDLVGEDDYLHFLYENGSVIELYPRVGVSDKIVNIYRAILSSFQVQPVGYDDNREVFENDFLGKGPTKIREIHMNGKTIIKKSRDLTKWMDMSQFSILPRFEYSNQARFYSNIYQADYDMPEIDMTETYIWPKINSIYIRQVFSMSPLTEEAGSVFTHADFNLTYLGDEETELKCQKPEMMSWANINYAYEKPTWKEEDFNCGEEVKFVFETVVKSDPWEIPILFRKLTEILGKCNKAEILGLWEKFKICDYEFNDDPLYPSSEKRFQYAFFLDALAFTWTDDSFEVISELVKEECLGSGRKRELILAMSMMPVHRIYSCNPITIAMDIFNTWQTNQTSGLMLGSIVGTYRKTKLWNRQCKGPIKQAITKLMEKFNEYFNAIPETFKRNPLPKDPKPTETDLRSWEWTIHSLMALANTGDPKTIPIFVEAIHARKLDLEGRLVAVESLEKFLWAVPERVRYILLGIYTNMTLEPEISSAAVPVIVASFPPIGGSIHKLKEFLLWLRMEKREEVKTFTYTYLMETITTDDPALYLVGRMLDQSMTIFGAKYIAIMKYGYFSSRAWRGFFSFADLVNSRGLPRKYSLPRVVPRDALGIGLDSHFYTNFNTKVPSGLTAKLKLLVMGYQIDLAKFGLRGSGLDTMITTLFSPTGYFRRGTRPIGLSGLEREGFLVDVLRSNISMSNFLEILGLNVEWNHKEEDRFLWELFGMTRLNALRTAWTQGLFGDNSNFDEGINFYSLVRLAEAWRNHTDFKKHEQEWYPSTFSERFSKWWDTLRHHVGTAMETTTKLWRFFTKGDWEVHNWRKDVSKNIEIFNGKYVIPTIVGLPLKTVMQADIHFGLEADLDLTYHSDGHFWSETRDKFILEGYLNPRVSFSSVLNVTIDDYFLQPTVQLHDNASFHFNQTGRATLYDNFTLTWELDELPEEESEIFKLQHDQYIIIDKEDYKYQIGIDKRNDTELIRFDPSELLGLRVFTNMSYANSTGVYPAPWFPFSGPAYLVLSIKRIDSRINQLQFLFQNFTTLNWTTGNFSVRALALDAEKMPIQEMRLNSTWYTALYNKTFYTVIVKSPSLNVTASFVGNQTTWHKIKEGRGFFYTDLSNTTFYFKFNRSYLNATIYRKRHTKEDYLSLLKVPEFRLDMNGSLINNTYGNFSALLSVEEWELPHWVTFNSTILGLFANVNVTSSFLRMPLDLGVILPLPLRAPVCHVTGDHFLTFDGWKYIARHNDDCEYVLARDRHLNDTFAVTIKGQDGGYELRAYVNETMYTLSMDDTMLTITDLRINNFTPKPVMLPYQEKHVINVRKVYLNNDFYIRMTLWVGLDIYFSRNDVILRVNGFYMNRTAGLCGNANYIIHDDMLKKNMELAENVIDFVNDWRVKCPKWPTDLPTAVALTPSWFYRCESYKPAFTVFPVESDEFKCSLGSGTEICKAFFERKYAGVVDPTVHHYYDICLRDVTCGLSPYDSIRAFLKAAHSKGFDIDGCLYGEYGPWSECENFWQKRERPVLCNPLKHVCGETTETRPCNDSVFLSEKGCYLTKSHIIVTQGAKLCRSRHRLPACERAKIDGNTICSDCSPVFETTQSFDEFYCIRSGESQEKFKNVSPTKLVHFKVKDCECEKSPSAVPPQ